MFLISPSGHKLFKMYSIRYCTARTLPTHFILSIPLFGSNEGRTKSNKLGHTPRIVRPSNECNVRVSFNVGGMLLHILYCIEMSVHSYKEFKFYPGVL